MEAQPTTCEQLLTAKEAASRLRVSRPYLARLVDERKLRAIRFGNGWKFREADVNNFIRRLSAGEELQ